MASRTGHRRGVVKSPEPHLALHRRPFHRQVFFFACRYSDGGAMNADVGGQREARRPAGVFVRSNAALYRFYGPASPFLALPVAGFAIMHGGADLQRNIFLFSGQLSESYVLKGNNGNMGTSYVKQAESCASRGCAPVPKPSGSFGNMGTEMADPDAGKSARVWLPPAPSSR
jgi:hypothetical protein